MIRYLSQCCNAWFSTSCNPRIPAFHSRRSSFPALYGGIPSDRNSRATFASSTSFSSPTLTYLFTSNHCLKLLSSPSFTTKMSQYAFPGANPSHRPHPTGPSIKPRRPSRWYANLPLERPHVSMSTHLTTPALIRYIPVVAAVGLGTCTFNILYLPSALSATNNSPCRLRRLQLLQRG